METESTACTPLARLTSNYYPAAQSALLADYSSAITPHMDLTELDDERATLHRALTKLHYDYEADVRLLCTQHLADHGIFVPLSIKIEMP